VDGSLSTFFLGCPKATAFRAVGQHYARLWIRPRWVQTKRAYLPVLSHQNTFKNNLLCLCEPRPPLGVAVPQTSAPTFGGEGGLGEIEETQALVEPTHLLNEV